MKNKEQELKELLGELKKNKKINVIVQFGSSVTKKEKPLSDIDLAIITSSEDKKIDIEIFSQTSERIDIVNFNKLPLYIQFEVFKHGKILFVRSKKILMELQLKILKQYLEMSYFYERMSRRILS